MSKLSSEILESQFGETYIEILNETPRIICTRAVSNDQILELSRVAIRRSGAAAFPEIHERITGGESIGKAFQTAKVLTDRDTRGTYQSELVPSEFTESFGIPGAATIVDLTFVADSERLPYADILEVFSPVVDWPYAAIDAPKAIHERVAAFAALLEALSAKPV